jgi:hypothetical protein
MVEVLASRGHHVTLSEVGDTAVQTLNDHNLVFLGSTCHDADLAKPAKQLLEAIDSSPPFKLAGFVTHATYMPEQSERALKLYERWAGNCIHTFHRVSQEKQVTFLGYFHCQGAASPPIEAFIRNTIITDDDEWETYIEETRKHPTKDDLQRAKAFALDVLDKCGG